MTFDPPDDELLRAAVAEVDDETSHRKSCAARADLPIRVVDLDTLIEIERATGRARDALVVPHLIAIRDRRA